MRAIGGLVLLVVGFSSMTTGGCELTAGSTRSSAADLISALENDGRPLDPELRKQLSAADASSTGMLLSGAFIAAAGALTIVAGLLLFANRGSWWVLMTCGFGVIAEILHWILLVFYPLGLIKIGLYVLGFIAGLRVLGPRRRDPRPAPA